MKFIDLTGQTFGRLTVAERTTRISGVCGAQWNCLCICGNSKIVVTSSLKNGGTKSCGCLSEERLSSRIHGSAGTTEYNSWAAMKSRCTKSHNPHYKNYGGRGITICDDWMDFPAFIKDMGLKPDPKLTIERIDNDKGYYKENCVWATRKQQSRNQRIQHNNKYGLTGVRIRKNGTWIAFLCIDNKRLHLGTFDNLLDAACARKSAENRYWT